MRIRIQKKTLWKKGAIALLIIGLVTGLAYALMQTQADVSGNTISTGTTNLQISTDGTHYSNSIPGFSFTNMLPGGYPAPAGGYPIYLKNTGSTDLDLSLSIPGTPSNPSDTNLNKLSFVLTEAGSQTGPSNFLIGGLIGGPASLEGELAPGATREYELQATMRLDADQGITVSGINLTFTGTARDVNDPDQSQ